MSDTSPAPPPAAPPASGQCGHENVIGDVAYKCERQPGHPDNEFVRHRHAASIDAGHAKGTDEHDGFGEATAVTWGEDENGDGQDWSIAWGSLDACAKQAAAPPASGRPQEAATPSAVAATVEALLAAARRKDHASRTVIGVNRSQLEGEAIGLDAAAELVRDRLEPAWDDLTACLRQAEGERDAARDVLNAFTAADALAAECERLRAELRDILDLCDQVTLPYEDCIRLIREDAIRALEAPDA